MRLTRQNSTGLPLLMRFWLVLALGLVGMFSPVTAAPQAPEKQTTQNATETALERIATEPAKPVYPPTMAGANQAYKDKNYQDALTILLKLEGDYAGKVEYDYLLGRCALETKQFDVAVAALTRVLTVDPDFAAARFELARTYYSKGVALLARGPFEQARAEFSLISKMRPPVELQQVIAGYQTNIDKYLKQREAEFDIYVEMLGGYDSNIGTQTSADSFSYYDPFIPGTVSYDTNPKPEEQESAILQLRSGIGIDWPLFSKYFEVFGGLEIGGRFHSDNSGYDHTWDKVSFGARHYGDNNKKTIRVSFRKTDILGDLGDRQRYHEEDNVKLSWEIKNTKNSTLEFFIKGGNSSYHAYGTYVFSVGYDRHGIATTYLLPGKRKSTIEGLLVMGEDYQQHCDMGPCQSMYEREVNGLRLAWGANIFNASRFYTSLYFENSKYHNQFFYQQRVDRRSEWFMGINTRISEGWYFRPEVHYTKNLSNLPIYEHERWLFTMRLGWSL